MTILGVVYGLGGHPISFNQTGSYFSTNFTKKLFFNLDSEITPEQQQSLPIFMTMDSSGISENFAAIFVESEGAPLEVEVMPGTVGILKARYSDASTITMLVIQIPTLLGKQALSQSKQALQIVN